MEQFYEAHTVQSKLSPLGRVLSWAHNPLILSKCKSEKERHFYLKLAVERHLSKRELEQQINNDLFKRTIASLLKISALLRELHPAVRNIASILNDTLGLCL